MQVKIAAAAAAIALMTSSAFAQTAATVPAPKADAAKASKAPAAKPSKAPVARTVKSLDCSKQADAKGLHGKPRKSFMSHCKKA
ncbi:PsiF family protein [Sphingomonas sp. MMSM20]|uniref:PsiF family protein n=1 Tax=Sphingomonas lycopersici TaxID=2951807 RepID=UPI0022381414|nr:PsiF family protein [Sphingomonas lycopersici]MCW6531940.1 PsiF family protein [Sphingomonas lycopersici]